MADNTNSSVSERNAAKQAKANEAAQLDAQQEKFYADFNAAKDKEAFLTNFAQKNLNMSIEQVNQLREDILAANTEDAQSRVLKKALNIAMPVWFLNQVDHSKVASGLHKLDDIVRMDTIANGSIRHDYQDNYKTDGKDVYYGSQEDGDKDWKKLTVGKKPLTDFENYITTHTIHMQMIRYLPLFTNAHKDTMLFMLQFSNVVKQMGEPLLVSMYGVRGKYLWDPANADSNIDDVTNDDFVIKESAAVKPDFEITTKTFKEVPTQLNILIQKFTSPSRSHYTDGTDAANIMLINGGKNDLKQQLRRSLSISDLQTIVPYSFINYLNNYQLAGSFHEGEADFLDEFKKSMRGFNYSTDFGSEYANITGLQDTLSADDKGVVSGSVDILIKTRDFMRIINQFDSTNRFGLPNNTEAINSWEDFGIDLNKDVDQFYARIRITVKPDSAPAQAN